MPRTHDEEIDRQILLAAAAEIELQGLNSFTLASVATRAGTTVAMIYRHFIDRDGLVAATFTALVESRYRELIEIARNLLEKPGELTLDDVVQAIPPLRYEGSEAARNRSQLIMATAMENTALRLALREIALRRSVEFEELIDEVSRRFQPGERFDPRIVHIYLVRNNPLIDDILGDDGMSNEEHRDFVRQLLVDSQS